MNELNVKNIAIYSFFKPEFNLEETRLFLLNRMSELEIKGTILLSYEGMNCSLSGLTQHVDTFLPIFLETIGLKNPNIKSSFCKKIAFKRSLIKIKEHIVASPGATPIDLRNDVAPYISPEEFHQWIENQKKMVILDTRNDYEFQIGRFKNSMHLGTKHFAEFEEDLTKAPDDWQKTPVVTFCTGGIRCEKAAPLMIKKGFQEVYQLDGGILNYFKKMGRGYFEGECFVFDERVALDEELHAK